MRNWRMMLATLVVGAVVTSASATIVVGFDPVNSTIPSVGGSTMVNIVANIPEGEAIVGWGLDFGYDNAIVSASVAVDPAFDPPLQNPDGDGLGGLAFPDAVFGPSVVLATITFDALANGMSVLTLGATVGDVTEGFAVDPDLGGGMADVQYDTGTIRVPEPASLMLLGLVALALRRRA